jgi:hypothetical protein
VAEGIMKMADDMRPEATLLIGWSYYALQHQKLIRYQLTQLDLGWQRIV